jgi:hypothetical protein
MKAIVLGIAHRKGTAKKSGMPFDFATLQTLRPIEAVSRESFQQRGYGYEPIDVKADPAAVDAFASLKFPCTVELLTEARPSPYGELELYVTGCKA